MTAGGMSQQLVDFSRVLVGHLRAGLAHASVVAQHGLRRRLGLVAPPTPRRSRSIVIPTMKQLGLQGRLRRRADRHRRHHRRDHSAEHDDGGLRRHRAGLDRRPVPRRHHPGHPGRPVPDGHRSRSTPTSPTTRSCAWCTAASSGRALARSVREVWPALLGPADHRRRHPVGIFTATEAGAVACLYAFIVGYFVYRKIRLRDLPRHPRRVGDHDHHGVGRHRGRRRDRAGCWPTCSSTTWRSTFVTGVSQNPTVVLLIVAVVMIVLGTFVDSLAVLLVFAPVAIELSKRYGIDPFQMGLVMVMCNQIGAVSPPTAPLLFVTTSIARARSTRPTGMSGRSCWPNAGAAAGDLHSRPVVLDPALLPRLSSWQLCRRHAPAKRFRMAHPAASSWSAAA